jgi:hypothetical protein
MGCITIGIINTIGGVGVAAIKASLLPRPLRR